MGKYDGKVTISTAVDNSGVEKDLQEVSGEFGGLKKVLNDMSKTISGAMTKPVSTACTKIKKDIEAAQKKVEQYQKQIQQSESAKIPLVEQAEQLGVELDEAKAKLAALQTQQQAAGEILSGNGDAEAYINAYAQKPQLDADVNQQQAKVDALQKQWDAVNDKVDGYNSKIAQSNKDMAAQETVVTELEKKLAAAEKETKRIQKNASGSKKEFSAMGKAVSSFTSRLKSIALGALIFNGISAGLREFTSYLSNTLKTNEAFTTALSRLKGALLTAAQPIYNALAPALIYLIRLLTDAALVVARFFAALTGTTVKANAEAAKGLYEEANALNEVGKAAKKTGKTVAGFDELNVLQDKGESSGASSGKNEVATPEFPAGDSIITGTLADIREGMEAILVLVGLVGAGILAWKIIDSCTDPAFSLKETFTNIASMALIVAGAILLITGYCDGWVNGVGWGNLLLTLGGIAAILVGITIKFGSFGLTIGAAAASIALLVLGVKDFINNGPSVQNTIMIIAGAIAAAVALASAGISVVVAAIIGAVTAVAAFTAAILLEEPAIMSVEEAQENLTAAKEAAVEAENGYINAVDAAESALKRLKDAEKTAGVTGAELYAQVQSGTLDYANMTDAQKEVYKAYLDNEQKQKDLEASTKAFNDAKKAETIASYENQLALAKESGNYDEFKKSVVAAFEAGELSADEARELIGKSMSEMSDDSQKTFMEDIPGDIKDGLDPSQYETTRKKIGDWFKQAGKDFSSWFINSIWQPIKDFWNKHIAPIFTAKFWKDLAKTCGNGLAAGLESAINGIIWAFESLINFIVGGLNKISINIPDWIPGIGGKRFGINISKVKFNRVSIPRLAQGAVIPPNREFLAVLGDQKNGTNIEAPLSTIQEALANVLADRGDGNITINFTGDLAQLARVLKPVIEKEGKRVGTGMVRKAGA